MVDDPASTFGIPSASQDGILVPTTVPSQASSELTPAASATPHNEPPTRSTLSPQASAENGNEAVAGHEDIAVDRATVPSTLATPRLTQRPQRQRRPPEKTMN